MTLPLWIVIFGAFFAVLGYLLTGIGVALLVDEYHEDWTQLWYILVRGKAKLISSGREHSEALRLLREKYSHYASSQLLHEEAPVIQIVPVKITSWGRL